MHSLPRLFALAIALVPTPAIQAQEPVVSTATVAVSTPAPVFFPADFKASRGVHLSAWAAGAPKARARFLDNMRGTVLNTVVVPVKEIDGKVYIPGVARAKELGTTQLAIPNPEAMLREMKERGLYTVARVAVFKDDTLPRKRPEWAVRGADGGPWLNAKGVSWVDPYQRPVWEYNLDVAEHAAKLGFDEIQFDYIRFPSDGDTRQCRYSRPDHSPAAAVQNLKEFLHYAHARLKPSNVRISVAIFGMTTTAKDDMGIGQRISSMAELVDFISPMMYPSHYAKGEYGLNNPNHEPYKVINRGLNDAKKKLKESSYKLRPYLQDFSLGSHYGPTQVRAQILAAQRQGIESWLLWNPGNRYQWEALRGLTFAETPVSPEDKPSEAEAPELSQSQPPEQQGADQGQ